MISTTLILLFLGIANAFTVNINVKHITRCRALQAQTTQEEAKPFDDGFSTSSSTSGRRALLVGSTLGLALSLNPSPAVAATSTGAQKFVGKYSDPINHPGGTRQVNLIDGADVGDYQLAEVVGGGGRGEPKEYVLPAVVVGDRAIIIDFSPKGGPRDFSGVLEQDGSIKFIRDGNRWPRLE